MEFEDKERKREGKVFERKFKPHLMAEVGRAELDCWQPLKNSLGYIQRSIVKNILMGHLAR